MAEVGFSLESEQKIGIIYQAHSMWASQRSCSRVRESDRQMMLI